MTSANCNGTYHGLPFTYYTLLPFFHLFGYDCSHKYDTYTQLRTPSPLSQKVPYILTPYYIEGCSVVITLISSSMRLLVGVGFLFMSDSALDRVVALIGLPVFLDSRCPPFSIAFFQFQPMRLPSSRALNSTATLRVFSTLRLKLLLHSNKDCMSSIDTSDTQNR